MDANGTTERVLRLLSLLQRRPSWTAAELAATLGVTERCVRRDVERLRSLGYPVLARVGVGGGYRLGAGTKLPPLLLDDEEAIATAVSLRLATGGTVVGAEDAALRAMTKLHQVMPPRLRSEVRTLHEATALLPGPVAAIDADTLMTIARACRDQVRVRFAYRDRNGTPSPRTVEPVRMVTTGRRWYLLAFDLDRDDWRTFRLDRMAEVVASTFRSTPREHPDPVAHVHRSVSSWPVVAEARIRLDASADHVRALVPVEVGRVGPDPEHPDDPGRCLLVAGVEDPDWLALHLARLGVRAEILGPEEVRAAVARLGARISAMVGVGG
ncbi:helix-turn-helix transcriptional regulator [Kineococcus gynurae]|uniref:Helix-turn-helix transcriptional regulator n=1 Tax=Kineococcus gynurae TaxID=452979 RepID=A0ABV5LPJ7_9ACTN